MAGEGLRGVQEGTAWLSKTCGFAEDCQGHHAATPAHPSNALTNLPNSGSQVPGNSTWCPKRGCPLSVRGLVLSLIAAGVAFLWLQHSPIALGQGESPTPTSSPATSELVTNFVEGGLAKEIVIFDFTIHADGVTCLLPRPVPLTTSTYTLVWPPLPQTGLAAECSSGPPRTILLTFSTGLGNITSEFHWNGQDIVNSIDVPVPTASPTSSPVSLPNTGGVPATSSASWTGLGVLLVLLLFGLTTAAYAASHR